jgi:hypothetical protein
VYQCQGKLKTTKEFTGTMSNKNVSEEYSKFQDSINQSKTKKKKFKEIKIEDDDDKYSYLTSKFED